MSEDQIALGLRELEEHTSIELEGFDDAALGVLDGVVHLVWRQVHELRRKVGEQTLEVDTRSRKDVHSLGGSSFERLLEVPTAELAASSKAMISRPRDNPA